MKTTAVCLALILLFTAGAWAGAEKVLYAFCSQENCADGAYPYAGVIADKAHNLYGTTPQGGDNFNGVVYELKHTKSGWKESVLYKLTGGADGAAPTGQLVFDTTATCMASPMAAASAMARCMNSAPQEAVGLSR